MAQTRFCAGVRPHAHRGERRRDASLLQPAGLLWTGIPRQRTISSSRNIISPISTCCLSAISPTGSPTHAAFETPWGKVAQLPTAISTACSGADRAGFYHDKIDGKAGMLTRSALGAYQKANGLKLDCWPTAAVLQQMQPGGR